jgi:hypothetical protein
MIARIRERISCGRYGNRFFFLPSISIEESFSYIHLKFDFWTFYLDIAIKHNQNEIMSQQTQDKLIEFFESLNDDMNRES